MGAVKASWGTVRTPRGLFQAVWVTLQMGVPSLHTQTILQIPKPTESRWVLRSPPKSVAPLPNMRAPAG